MSVDRVFIFHETSDNFRGFDFAGAAQVSDNWDPSLTTVRGAAADAAGNIFVLDLATNPATVRRWNASRARQSALDITMNNTGAYEGIALTDTHLVALRGETLQYYDLSTRGYVSSMDATLPTRTSPEYYSGICRAGDFLYLVTHNDNTYQPRIYKRNLDGSAVSDWAGQGSTTALTIFATTEHIVTVRKNGGHWDRWEFDGTPGTTLNTIGAGVWQASYTTYEQLSVEAIDEQFIAAGTKDYVLLIDITGNPDSVDAKGHMEGFFSDWDVANAQLRIEAEDVTRLINGVTWDLDVRKGSQILTPKIKYNVIPPAPILQTLPTIHLYRGVPIHFDILIEHIPPLIIPNARLLGLKSELLAGNASGINVSGLIPVDANFAADAGNVTIIIPSETDEEAEMHEYPYQIEAGRPPAVGTPTFVPKGAYGKIEFDEVTHALGYEWTLQSGDAAVWNFFSGERPVIDPETIEVTPGQLSVTITFPNIAGASRYEYMLESENHTVDWTLFEGTLSNNMITTIIPDLQDGVRYTLRLRVASPWQGSDVSITVYGGRMCYTLQITPGANRVRWLYVFHTGHPNGTNAGRVKRLLLPTSLAHPDAGGLAVNSDGDVFILNLQDGVGNEKALYVFEADTIANAADGSRLTQDRKNPFPSSALVSNSFLRGYGMAEYENELYIYFNTALSAWRGFNIVPIPATDGTELAQRGNVITTASNPTTYGVSVTAESIWYKDSVNFNRPRRIDRTLFTLGDTIRLYQANGATADTLGLGFEVVGDDVYNMSGSRDMFEIFRVNDASRHVLDFQLRLSSGLTYPRFLGVQK